MKMQSNIQNNQKHDCIKYLTKLVNKYSFLPELFFLGLYTINFKIMDYNYLRPPKSVLSVKHKG